MLTVTEIMCIIGLGVGVLTDGNYALASLIYQELIEYILQYKEANARMMHYLAVAYYNLAFVKMAEKDLKEAKRICRKGCNVCEKGDCGIYVALELKRMVISIDIMSGNAKTEELVHNLYDIYKDDMYRNYEDFNSYVYDRRMIMA